MPTIITVPPVTCAVVSTDLGRLTRFQGRLLSSGAVGGSYHFAIAKTGPSGRSAIHQGGRFVASANLETIVGSAAVGVESGAFYEVSLSIDIGGKIYACEPLTGGKV